MVRAVDILDSTLKGKPTIQKLYKEGAVSHVSSLFRLYLIRESIRNVA